MIYVDILNALYPGMILNDFIILKTIMIIGSPN